jgi:hypothetical protein
MSFDPSIDATLPKVLAPDAAAIKAARNSLPGKLLGRITAILAAAVWFSGSLSWPRREW